MSDTNLAIDIAAIRRLHPLVHNITNYVAMDFTANALLAIGASPIMAHAEEELPELLKIANALVLNIGTLDAEWIQTMHTAVELVQKIPVVLDPVGAGASKLRTNTARDLLATNKIDVLRGNAAEILAVAGTEITSRGVDSVYETEAAAESARSLAQKFDCVVVVSGPIDLVVSATDLQKVDHGHPIMTQVTGMGCAATAIVGAFCAVNSNYLQAAINAMSTMGIAGERSSKIAIGPASFKVQFIDTLYQMATNAALK